MWGDYSINSISGTCTSNLYRSKEAPLVLELYASSFSLGNARYDGGCGVKEPPSPEGQVI